MFIIKLSCMDVRGEMNLITLENIDSTNVYAKNNLEILEDKSVIMALRQTSGRGRLTRSWVDLGEGNLFLSFVLKPSEVFKDSYSNLTQYLSVILCKIFEEYGLHPQIKWPNDVLIDGKKISGILSETVMQGNNFKGLVLGIGVNLNAKQSDIDEIPDKIATALNLVLGKFIDLNIFANKLITKFFENYDQFLLKGFDYIKSEYISRVSFIGKEICVKGFNDSISGIARSINDCGELIIESGGKEVTLTIGDIL